MYFKPNYLMYPSFKIPIFAVRSFGIIGGGAVLFGASAIAGQAILGTLGEIENIIPPFLDNFKIENL